MELFGEAWPFSQAQLLTAEEFARAAGERRLVLPGRRTMDVRALEELHRTGLLVPMFAVNRTHRPRTGRMGLDAVLRGEPRTDRTVFLTSAHAGLDLADAAETPYAQWAASGQDYFYSPHQILGLVEAAGFLELLDHCGDAGKVGYWRLRETAQPAATDLQAAASWRSFATALTFLDSAYWPQVVRRVNGELARWRDFREGFDALSALGRFDPAITGDAVHGAVAVLRTTAAQVDDLGDFYDLVRRADGESWESLAGGARVAMDYRIAGEMLELCAIDAGFGLPEVAPDAIPLQQQGLRSRNESLDGALTKLRLSPHPSVVLAVEGETEALLVPRVLKQLLGTVPARELITVDCFGGADKDLTSLARYAAAPVPGVDLGEAVVLDRPVTRFVVLVDAEGKYKTPEMRERQRRKLVLGIANQLPSDLRDEVLDPSASHVEIHTWGALPFEFEHFTDEELAEALEAAAGVGHPFHDRPGLVDAVCRERTRRSPNIEHAWEGEGPMKVVDGPKKVQIADALWATLELKIARALDTRQSGPPVLQGVVRAIELALKTPRSGVALFRRK